MTRRQWLQFVFALLMVGLGTGWWLQHRPPAPAPKPVPALAPNLSLGASDVLRLAPGVLAQTVRLTGTLEAMEQSQLTAPVDGEIQQVHVRVGSPVRRGQLLLEFNAQDLNLRQAEQQATLQASQAQERLARANFEQQQRLYQSGFISLTAFQNAEKALQSSQAQTQAQQAMLALARNQVHKTEVRAPIDGVVAERRVEPGQRVGLNAPLLLIVNTQQLELSAHLAPEESLGVRVGQKVSVQLDGVANPQTWPAQVARLGAVADASRRIPVFIRINNPTQTLRAGLIAHANIEVQQAQGWVLPKNMIQTQAQQHWVWRISGTGATRQLQALPVTLRLENGSGQVLLEGDLRQGDLLLRTPSPQLRTGQRVSLSP